MSVTSDAARERVEKSVRIVNGKRVPFTETEKMLMVTWFINGAGWAKSQPMTDGGRS